MADMQKFSPIVLVIIPLVMCSWPNPVFGHGGRLDANSGHHNHFDGTYHYHHPPHSRSGGGGGPDDDDIQEQFGKGESEPYDPDLHSSESIHWGDYISRSIAFVILVLLLYCVYTSPYR